MNKHLSSFISLFFRTKNKRKIVKKALREFSFKEYIIGIKLFFKIYVSKTNSKILILEVNPFHGECMYSFYSYLKNIDKEADIFFREEVQKLGLFEKENANFELIKSNTIKMLDNKKFFDKYDKIFVNSFFIWENQRTIEYYLKNFLKNKPVYTIDHAPGFYSPIKSHNKNIHKFVLAEFLAKRHSMSNLSTIIFPEKRKNIKNKDKTFISVGAIGDQSRKDSNSFITFMQNNPNIQSCIIGNCPSKEYQKKVSSVKNITFLGRTSFATMFEQLNKAHFLPMLIHGETKEYYRNAISGNINIAIAFGVIPIIDKEIAELYNISDNIAVIYDEKEEFYKAMEYAYNMSDSEYKSKYDAIIKYNDELLEKSQNKIADLFK